MISNCDSEICDFEIQSSYPIFVTKFVSEVSEWIYTSLF